MGRAERRDAERRSGRAQAPRAKAGALAAASLALVPFLGGGGVPLAIQSTVDAPVLDADGQVPQQPALSPEVLAAAGDPAMLAQQLPSFADVPLSTLDAPVVGALGIPESALRAYQRAEQELARLAPDCHVSWSLLAAIGRVESNHARGGRVDGRGTTVNPILGPILNGVGFAAVPDTDGGVYDGDTRWDRAVGPMQFIPGTWRNYASDGNGDGVADPGNLYDAALAAGKYLCAGGGDLRDPQQRAQAVFQYNHSDSYVRTVLLWADAYARGASSVPDGQLPAGPVAGSAALPGPVVEAPPAPVTPQAPPSAPVTTPPPPSTPPATTSSTTSTTSSSSSSRTTTTTSSSSSTTTTTTTTTTSSSGGSTTPPPTCPPPSSTSDSATSTTSTTPASTTAPSTTNTPPPC
ncbi:lytic transglycosylase domain-containing protein [Amycolatopsis sacchari]|uniref:lytic transglycosylase domain-containing protein n=1 Tax=Amycolatopsis sacchari TaxID=115433 RepID=UPI003D74719D